MDVPDYMKSTVAMLRSAYPDEIPDGEIAPLMSVLGEAGMSNRSVAAAVGYYYGVDYKEWLYQVQVCELDDTTTEITRMIVVDRLKEHGYDEWLAATKAGDPAGL